MTDPTIIDSMVATDGTLGNAYERILRMKRNGVFETILGDANNFNPVPTPITQQREVYGNKGRPAVEKIGDSWVITFNVELVRNPITKAVAAAQAWLVELVNIANRTGGQNKTDFQWFDAYDPALPAHEGTFNVAVVDQFNAYNEKAGYTVTLTSDGVVDDIDSPIDNDGAPIIESIPTPNGKGAGASIVVKGYHLTAITAATIGGVAATEIVPVDQFTVVLELPTGTAGAQPVRLTNAVGISEPVNYTRS
jgi:hypothetical protein